jgi:superfamily I DNA/RNA helicase
VLAGPETSFVSRLTVAPFDAIAVELYEAAFGHKPRLATEAQVRGALIKAGEGSTFTERFLFAEWTFVFDAWQVEDAAAYAAVPRLGRKNRLGAKQRERLATIFLAARESLRRQHLMTMAELFGAVGRHYATQPEKPFGHVVVDEAQDLGVPELRFLAAIVAPGTNVVFFAGDLGQRIFQQPFSWKGLGVDVRGRSATLKVNYRTSHQIRQVADRLLPPVVRDVDNREEERKGTISIFDGPVPEIAVFADPTAERDHVAAFLRAAIDNDIAPAEIGIFVRSRVQLPRAHAAAEAAGVPWADFTDRSAGLAGKVGTGVMHLAKGLELAQRCHRRNLG